MPFNGGGGGALPAHVHNSVPLQGGPLDFANDTIASLNVGSTTFSDGAALQELVIGNAGDSLLVNGAGTAPEWGTSGGSWNLDGSDSSTVGASSLSVSGMTGRDITKINFQIATNTSTRAYPLCQLNGISSATYDTYTSQGDLYFGDVGFTVQNQIDNGLQNIIWQGEILLYKGISGFGFTGVTGTSVTGSVNTALGSGYYIVSGTHNQDTTADITQVDLLLDTGNIYGKMQVLSMDYQ